jgi:hypothetical protein
MGMVERGGKLRLVPVPDEKKTIMQPVLEKHISKDVEHPIHLFATKDNFDGKHKAINHTRSYAIGSTHTNTIENAFSLLKRGLMGSYHQVSTKHLSRYRNEFGYRFNRRRMQLEMFDGTLKHLTRGEARSYKELTASKVSET